MPNPFKSFGWGTRIRTLIHGVRVRCPTIERSPIKPNKRNYRKSKGESIKKCSPQFSLDRPLPPLLLSCIQTNLGSWFVAQYEDCIVFLLAKAYQRAHSAFKQKLAPFGITPVQQLILMLLGEEGFLSPAEISEKVAMDSATLSGVLERMAEGGMIKREENQEDRRSIRVSLTARAKKMQEDLAGQRKAINEELTEKLTLEEKLLLKRMLRDLKA